MKLNLHDIVIEPRKQGLYQPTKGSYPVRYGERAQITTPELLLELDVEGRIKYVTGRTADWPDALEFLKRTDANDWVYYSIGEYQDLVNIYGEHYLPCPEYTTNRPLGGEPFRRDAVQQALGAWPAVLDGIREARTELPAELRVFADSLANSESAHLARRAAQLHEIIGTAIPVLPPDARHVDYDVIPLIVADGCRYGCRFCRVNDARRLTPRTPEQIDAQLERLRGWLGQSIGEYQGLFLGLHDALAVDEEQLCRTLEAAHGRLGFDGSRFTRPQVSLFGSVHSLIAAPDRLFDWLDHSPWSVFINVGLEAADDATLQGLGKPLTATDVDAGFRRITEINERWPNVEVTANFILVDDDGRADEAMLELINRHVPRRRLRGVCYLSPLMLGPKRPRAKKRPLLQRIHRLQRGAPVPLLLYLIQRL